MQVSAGQCRSVQVNAGQCRLMQFNAGQVMVHVLYPVLPSRFDNWLNNTWGQKITFKVRK